MSELIQDRFIDRYNSSGANDSFEDLALEAMRSKLQHLLNQAFPESDLAKLSASRISSYGTIAKSCRGQTSAGAIRQLLDWVESATSAKFEGTVPPFCLPSENFGPDVVCLLWNQLYTTYSTVLCQAKFKESQSQPEALRTLVPEWLFFDRRDTENRALTNILVTPELERWKNLESKLVGRNISLLRCLVEFPVSNTKTSVSSARVHRNDITHCKNGDGCKNKHDLLLTIDGTECKKLFSNDVLDMLSSVKGEPKLKRQKNNKA